MDEILVAVFKDQKSAVDTQFKRITDFDFTYCIYELQRS